jgi:GTP-binding protein HflX
MLERLYRRRVPPELVTTPELAGALADASRALNRQVGVLLQRSGVVDFVVVGDAAHLELPDIGRLRAGSGRFRGLRLVHTHLRGEPLTRDDLVDVTRLRLDLVAALGVSMDGRALSVEVAHSLPENDAGDLVRRIGPLPLAQLELDCQQLVLALEDEFARVARARPVLGRDGRAVLVQVSEKKKRLAPGAAEEAMAELRELARTAGVEVVDVITQSRDRIDPKWVLGKGKLEELVVRAMQRDAQVIVFDRELTAGQATAISAVTDLKVVDRTQLILDIFAQRAGTTDGKLQVELAQLKYMLPRLAQKDDSLSRLTGGIGGRGPGETKLEVGRRRARERVTRLEERLRTLSRKRRERRRQRERTGVPVVAIVGYTNAGKSTLLNALTGADVLATDLLFSTLDPRTRRLWLPPSPGAAPDARGREVLLTDTVGFIRQMPGDLWAAFRATFEEICDADLILHVVDESDPAADDHVRTVESLIVELGIAPTPRLVLWNKADRVPGGRVAVEVRTRGGVAISAIDPGTLAPVLSYIRDTLPAPAV